ncbi:protein VACUOLELESS1-like [Chenopodium quinoa]|uniref:protein VACUOLELESS1-like n=1 Tax=Chenopodium quinoa TaxID=63459 RepID=UPI000B799A80|nr:protein VACUOLELESS1-like [Chenopodium quinoa]
MAEERERRDGTVYRYNIHAKLIEPSFSLGKECFEQSVVDCVFWGNGVVCMNEGFQFFSVPDFSSFDSDKGVVKMADLGLKDPPLCMAVIKPKYTMSGNVEVLLGVGDHVLLVDEDGVQQLGVGVGPLQKMVVSRDGKYLASFNHDGRLLVITSNFASIIFEYSCETERIL